jgi:hypothetical protein
MNIDEDINDSSDSESDDEFIEVKIERSKEEDEAEMRYLGFLNGSDSEYVRHFNMNINVKIDQNGENCVLIENMKDFYKELKNCHLDKIKKWIKVRIFIVQIGKIN